MMNDATSWALAKEKQTTILDTSIKYLWSTEKLEEPLIY